MVRATRAPTGQLVCLGVAHPVCWQESRFGMNRALARVVFEWQLPLVDDELLFVRRRARVKGAERLITRRAHVRRERLGRNGETPMEERNGAAVTMTR